MIKHFVFLFLFFILTPLNAFSTQDVMEEIRESFVHNTNETKEVSVGDLKASVFKYRDTHPKLKKLIGGVDQTAFIHKEDVKKVSFVMMENGAEFITIDGKASKDAAVIIHDDNGDGIYDSISYSSFDENMNLISTTHDSNFDGQPDAIFYPDQEKASLLWIENQWNPIVERNEIKGVVINGEWQEYEYQDGAFKLK